MPFAIRITFEDEDVVLGLDGGLTQATFSVLPMVMETLVDVVDGIVFDFKRLDTVDDFGVEALERCMTAATATGYRVGVRNTRGDREEIAPDPPRILPLRG